MRPAGLSRRGFFEQSTSALVLSGLPLWYARSVAAEPTRRSSADRPLMGAIGVGGRGTGIMLSARDAGARIVALCDVDAGHRAKAVQKFGGPLEQFSDFRELLQRDDIEAVTIGTPDHWHALIAIEAMRRGKDVYCEKPLSLTVAEGRAMVEAARRYGRVFQTGSQQRSNNRFRLACELVRNGRLGKIATVETRIGANPKGGPFAPAPVPEGLDWDLWLGQTPEVEYLPQRFSSFRWWYEYSGGKVTDWGAHHNDIAQWALGTDETGPVSIAAQGSNPEPEPNAFNSHPEFKITYTYAAGVNDVCDGTKLVCRDAGENGVKLIGVDGAWIFVSRDRIEASQPAILDEPLGPAAIRLDVSRNHMRNFLEAVASRDMPICDVAVGHRSATICHLGNIALRTGHRLAWDPEQERCMGDALAQQMLSRPMRGPWTLSDS